MTNVNTIIKQIQHIAYPERKEKIKKRIRSYWMKNEDVEIYKKGKKWRVYMHELPSAYQTQHLFTTKKQAIKVARKLLNIHLYKKH